MEDDTHCEQVDVGIRSVTGDVGWPVGERSTGHATTYPGREAEVDEHRSASLYQDDVLRLDVSVDDARALEVGESVGIVLVELTALGEGSDRLEVGVDGFEP